MIAAFACALRARHANLDGLTTWNGSDPAQRFTIYRNNVALSLREALAAKFPFVAELVGEACFAALARAYLDARPPQARRLALLGEDFADFVESLPDLAPWPYLGDVARLEAARLAAYHAADAEAATPAALLACADLAGARARLHPSLRLVASRFAVVSLTRRLEAGAALDGLALDAPETAMVGRRAGVVEIEALPPDEAAFLDAALSGAALFEAAQAGLARDAAFDAGAFLSRLVVDGRVVGFEPEGGTP